MPGSGIPERLREWPLNEEGSRDVAGMTKYCADQIQRFGRDYEAQRARVDQAKLDSILERLVTDGIQGLRDNDVPHLANACGLTMATDSINEARACLQMIAKYTEGRRAESN